MKNTKIEWADHTFNPWIGCTKVSPACDNCYAEVSMPAKMQRVAWGPNAERRRTSESNWQQPLRWDKEAARLNVRTRVFCASLADVFDNTVPVQWREDLFKLIDQTPRLDWLLLTKRIGNVGNMLPVPFDFDRLYPNVWIGATICNQEEADRDIRKLLDTPAAKRFVSMEPLLGPVDLTNIPMPGSGHGHHEFDPIITGNALSRHGWKPSIDWVIVGGESGQNARPMHPAWARSLRDQCAAAGVPFLFKQWGEWVPYEDSEQPPFMWSQHGHEIDGHALPDFESEDGQRQTEWLMDWSDMLLARRVGKKSAGRLLDGREWNGIPKGSTP